MFFRGVGLDFFNVYVCGRYLDYLSKISYLGRETDVGWNKNRIVDQIEVCEVPVERAFGEWKVS
jgi:hypothetical protein